MGGMMGAEMPGPDPAVAAAHRRQEARIENQEQRAEAQENQSQRKLASSGRARRTGGLRLLLNTDRDNAQAGIDSLKNTLGANV